MNLHFVLTDLSFVFIFHHLKTGWDGTCIKTCSESTSLEISAASALGGRHAPGAHNEVAVCAVAFRPSSEIFKYVWWYAINRGMCWVDCDGPFHVSKPSSGPPRRAAPEAVANTRVLIDLRTALKAKFY